MFTNIYQISFNSKYIPITISRSLNVIMNVPQSKKTFAEKKVDFPPQTQHQKGLDAHPSAHQIVNLSQIDNNNNSIFHVHDKQDKQLDAKPIHLNESESFEKEMEQTETSSSVQKISLQSKGFTNTKLKDNNDHQHIQKILHFIRYKIEKSAKKNYPFLAQKRQIEGKVLLRFSINESGNIQSSEILERSGYAILDASALKALKDAAPFPYLQQEIEVPIEFTVSKESELP